MQTKRGRVLTDGHSVAKLHARRLGNLELKINRVLDRTKDHVPDTLGLPIDRYSAIRFREIARDQYPVMDARKQKDFDRLMDGFYNGILNKIDKLESSFKSKHVIQDKLPTIGRSEKRKIRQLKSSNETKPLKTRHKADLLRSGSLRVNSVRGPRMLLHPERISAEK
jgi:hypothetical protein